MTIGVSTWRWLASLCVTSLCTIASSVYAHEPDRRATECLGLAMYWEARGEGTKGMKAVGAVVLNRVASEHFPDAVCEVVFEGGEKPPCQFSWWCDGKSDRPRNLQQWRAALKTAEGLLARRSQDPTRGALFFHSTSIKSSWHKKRKRTAKIGRHVFYR